MQKCWKAKISEAGHLLSFFVPTPEHLDSLYVPTPENLSIIFKKNAFARGLARGGWALLELTDALITALAIPIKMT